MGDLSLGGQTKLLRFLQEKIIERVGSNHPVHLDVRVIAATHRNLEEAVKEGQFREDLYYRLNMFECQLVPLRFRNEDILVLIHHFFREFQATHHFLKMKTVSDSVLKVLLSYGWPGNIRELRNVLERMVLLSQGRETRLEHLPDSVRDSNRRFSENPSGNDLNRTLEEVEREHIEKILVHETNQERAAQILGTTTVTLWRKRKQYGLA